MLDQNKDVVTVSLNCVSKHGVNKLFPKNRAQQ